LHDEAVIIPVIIGSRRVKGVVNGKSNDGGVFAESGDGVVEEISVREMDDVGGPEVAAIAGDGGSVPGGQVGEDTRAADPMDEVFRMARRNSRAS